MLRIQILGGLQIMLADTPVLGFVSSKAQALLCYLVMNRAQPHLRTVLAAMFWGDRPDEDAATNLRQVIANLRRLLKPYLHITRQSLAFNADAPYWLDVEAFESTHDSTLYHGELLAGFGLPDAPTFDDWLTAERERLHDLAILTLREESARCMANGDEEGAITCLNRLLAIDPLQEEAHRQLMRTLAINGQRSAALAQYEKCRAILARELGIEPEADTKRLFGRIRTAQKLTNLPTETMPFVDRQGELAELAHRLADPACHLITIVGLGGIGKTRLAVRLGHLHADRMLHGAVMVSVTSISTTDGFLMALAGALNLSLSELGSHHQQILDYLREKHLLLILDNVDELLGAANDLLKDVLASAAEIKIVVTAHERLHLPDEWVLALDGLPCEQTPDQPDQPTAAHVLFWEMARRIRGDDLLTNQSVEAVGRICRLLTGMPLAIELAAAWTRLLTPEELADELTSNLGALELTTRDGEARHRSLRAVFDHSWQLFSPQERQVLVALSVFVVGFTREAAEKVAGASMPTLLGLSDKMLLRREGVGRFSLHEMVRRYLMERLTQSGNLERVRLAYVTYFAHFPRQRESRLKSSEQQQAMEEIRRDIDNIHAAWHMAVDTGNVTALHEMMVVLSLFHDMRSSWRVGEALFQGATRILEASDSAIYGECLSHLALFCSRLDREAEAQQLAQQSLRLLAYEQSVHREHIARSLMVLGNCEDARGDFLRACQYYVQALEMRLASGDEWGSAQAYLSLAAANGQAGNNAEAQLQAHRGLEISQRCGDMLLTTKLRTVLAILAAQSGDLDTAESLHRANLGVFERLGSLEGLALTFNGLAVVEYFRQHYERAQHLFVESLDMNRRIGARVWEANTLNNLGEVARDSGDYPAAVDHFRHSQAIFRSIGNERHAALLQREIDILIQRG